ncbi:hypothetical protein [Winogradskyella luteola]|uniref:Uncharacterized protein n=1 Tax=Winogradskyella luteola TaxID=2828330 RepID=A0A9X1JS27_9FLAO|nr:hypothetical protein [Winogradskyella luteola]MBV7269197.1 hypothetical protein [Winogradskyella luteola]
MKTIKVLTIMFGILFTVNLQAQKVKIKKDIAYVDKVEYLKFDGCGTFSESCTIMNFEDEDLIVLQYHSFEKPNPIPRNPKSKTPYQSTITESYTELRFMDFELECEVQLSKKKLVKALYKSKVLNEDGTVNKEKAQKFARKYHRNVSGERPGVIITN